VGYCSWLGAALHLYELPYRCHYAHRRLARLGSPRSWSPHGRTGPRSFGQPSYKVRRRRVLPLAQALVPAASARRSPSTAPLLVRRERDRVSEPPTPGTDSLSVSVLQNSLNPLMPLGAEACGFAAIALIRFAVIQLSKLMDYFASPARERMGFFRSRTAQIRAFSIELR
jgi:hypothetical protein